MRQAPLRIAPAESSSASSNRATLQRLADQMSDIANTISRLHIDAAIGAAPRNGASADQGEITSALLHEMLVARRGRTRFFPDGLFSDPAWDILLDLLKSRLSQRRVSVSSVCVASNAPPTTALRWIKLLENEGLVTRRADPFDGRRFYIELTEQAEASLGQYFASVGLERVL